MTKQRRFQPGTRRYCCTLPCRCSINSPAFIFARLLQHFIGFSLDGGREKNKKQGINKQRARPVPAGTCENEAAAKKVPPPPLSRTQYAVIASQAGVSYLC